MKGWQKALIAGAAVAGIGAVGVLYYSKAHAQDALKEEFHRMGDVNRDGVIDNTDLDLLQAAYGSKPGSPNWNPDCDLDGSGKVDLFDATILLQNYGLTFKEWVKTKGYSRRQCIAEKLPLIKEI